MGLLLPLYIAGGNYYACGKLLMYSTIAYLADAATAEWAAAMGAAVSMVGIAVVVCRVVFVPNDHRTRLGGEHISDRDVDARQRQEPARSSYGYTWSYLWRLAAFTTVLIALCIPSALYAVTVTLPKESVLPLPISISFLHNFASAILAIINSVVLPIVVKWCTQDARLSRRRLLLISRTMVTWVIPCAVFYYFENDCEGHWMEYWDPCQPGSKSFTIEGYGGWHLINGNPQIYSTPLVTTNETCRIYSGNINNNPLIIRDGCARGMVSMLSSLLLLKMVIAGFLLVWLRIEWVMWDAGDVHQHHRECCRPCRLLSEKFASLLPKLHVGERVAQLLTWAELAAMLGTSIPLLLPLVAMAVYVSKLEVATMAYRHGVQLEGFEDAKVGPVVYLVFGGVMSNLAVYFVFANSRLHGQTLVLIMCCVCSFACVFAYLVNQCGQWWRRLTQLGRGRTRSMLEMMQGHEEYGGQYGEEEEEEGVEEDEGFSYTAL